MEMSTSVMENRKTTEHVGASISVSPGVYLCDLTRRSVWFDSCFL